MRPYDPPRAVAQLVVSGANVVDLRDAERYAALGLIPAEVSVLWQPERALGLPATRWWVFDAVRALGADGMIYRARSDPERWHLVLFHRNVAQAALVTAAGFDIAARAAP